MDLHTCQSPRLSKGKELLHSHTPEGYCQVNCGESIIPITVMTIIIMIMIIMIIDNQNSNDAYTNGTYYNNNNNDVIIMIILIAIIMLTPIPAWRWLEGPEKVRTISQ